MFNGNFQGFKSQDRVGKSDRMIGGIENEDEDRRGSKGSSKDSLEESNDDSEENTVTTKANKKAIYKEKINIISEEVKMNGCKTSFKKLHTNETHECENILANKLKEKLENLNGEVCPFSPSTSSFPFFSKNSFVNSCDSPSLNMSVMSGVAKVSLEKLEVENSNSKLLLDVSLKNNNSILETEKIFKNDKIEEKIQNEIHFTNNKQENEINRQGDQKEIENIQPKTPKNPKDQTEFTFPLSPSSSCTLSSTSSFSDYAVQNSDEDNSCSDSDNNGSKDNTKDNDFQKNKSNQESFAIELSNGNTSNSILNNTDKFIGTEISHRKLNDNQKPCSFHNSVSDIFNDPTMRQYETLSTINQNIHRKNAQNIQKISQKSFSHSIENFYSTQLFPKVPLITSTQDRKECRPALNADKDIKNLLEWFKIENCKIFDQYIKASQKNISLDKEKTILQNENISLEKLMKLIREDFGRCEKNLTKKINSLKEENEISKYNISISNIMSLAFLDMNSIIRLFFCESLKNSDWRMKGYSNAWT